MSFPLLRPVKIAIVIWLAIMMLPYIALSFYVHPGNDEYGYTHPVRNDGWIETQIGFYQNWSGRYSSTILMTTNPLTFGSRLGFNLITLAAIILIFTSVFVFVNALTNERIGKIDNLLVTLLIVNLNFQYLPGIQDGFYWTAGMLNYQVAHIGTFFTLAYAINKVQRGGWLTTFVLSGMAFIASGFNETFTSNLLLILGATIFYRLLVYKKLDKIILVILAGALIGAIVMLSAPGNSHRMAVDVAVNAKFEDSLINAITDSSDVLSTWLIKTPLPAVALFIGCILASKKNLSVLSRFRVHPLFIALIAVTAVYVDMFLGRYFLGQALPHRAQNTTFILFIFLTILIAHQIIVRSQVILRLVKLNMQRVFVYIFLLVVPLTGLIMAPHFIDSIDELFSGRAAGNNAYMLYLYREIDSCKNNGVEVCYVHKIRPIDYPHVIIDYWLTDDPNGYGNTVIGVYNGLKSVALKTLSPSSGYQDDTDY